MQEVKKIENGIIIDHICAGKGLELYSLLKLDSIDCPCIIIKNIDSQKMGKKDMIKILDKTDINADIIGYFCPNITINIIQNKNISKIFDVKPPKYIKNIVFCKNTNCITFAEPEIDHIFKLIDPQSRKYSCVYCERIRQ
ncbi:MAG: aspartate carbamoyltransferase regulatory subunit [Oscillospiraceae bacterium]|jgi:aspartate carbamoyltransferase regulatory subunit|nr:aspartate carbamoyltransferase regulatory subunit [Oscillospiraceae bacterium]